MPEEIADIPGPKRAAIFLLGLGEKRAAAILKHMSPKEIQMVGEAMTSLGNVPNQQLATVVESFSQKINDVNPISIGTTDFTRRVMVQALGEDKARNVLNRVAQKNDTKGIDALKWMDPRSVSEIIKREHPQIIAIILTSLDSDQAAQVLTFLSDDTRADVLIRIARLDLIDPDAMQELDRVLEKQLGKVQSLSLTSLDGLKTAADILNHMDSAMEGELLDSIKQVDQELGDKVHELLFVFDNLLALDDRGMQRLLREIAVDKLVIALKGVDENLKDKFFSNMSARAADMLKEDLEAKGPVKLSEVEAVQKEILAVANKLSDDGEISLGKGGDDFV